MKDLFSLKNKIAVITGGLGQLGQQYAIALMSYGAKIACIDIIANPFKKNIEFEKLCSDNKIKIYQADITIRSEVKEVFKKIKNDLGVPNVLINNAAIDSPPDAPDTENGPFEDYPENSLNKIIDVNIKAVFYCCQIFGKAMAENKGGSIINISSIYGIVSPNQDIYEFKRKNGKHWFKPAPYSLTKSALLNLTRYLATYWAKKNVRVNTLIPAGIFNNQDEKFLKEYCNRIPIGRMAREDEINGAVIFLASDASSYMTGANLVIDGGWTAW